MPMALRLRSLRGWSRRISRRGSGGHKPRLRRGMKVDGKHTRTIWVEPDGWSVGIIDQTELPHRFATLRLTTLEDAAHAITSMQVRGAPLIGAAAAYGVCLALRADASDDALGARLCDAAGDPPDRDQPQMGARRDDGGRAQPPARRSALAAAYRRAAEICDEDVAINQAIGRHGAQADRSASPRKEAGRTRQRAHPLQRRLARHRRFRHRAGADLRGARQRPAGPCLGRRDAAAQSGRRAHRLGARPARRAAHGDRRQYRRPPDAARPGRSRDRRHRPGHRATATSATRSARISRRSPRRTTACRSMWRCRRRPSILPSPTALRKSRSRSAAPTRSRP